MNPPLSPHNLELIRRAVLLSSLPESEERDALLRDDIRFCGGEGTPSYGMYCRAYSATTSLFCGVEYAYRIKATADMFYEALLQAEKTLHDLRTHGYYSNYFAAHG